MKTASTIAAIAAANAANAANALSLAAGADATIMTVTDEGGAVPAATPRRMTPKETRIR